MRVPHPAQRRSGRLLSAVSPTFSSAATAGLNAGPLQVGKSYGFYGYRLLTVIDRYGNTVSITNSGGNATISSPLGSITLTVHGAGSGQNNPVTWLGYSTIAAPGQRTWTAVYSEIDINDGRVLQQIYGRLDWFSRTGRADHPFPHFQIPNPDGSWPGTIIPGIPGELPPPYWKNLR